MKYRARKTLNGFLNSRALAHVADLKIETLAKEFSRGYTLRKFTYICNLTFNYAYRTYCIVMLIERASHKICMYGKNIIKTLDPTVEIYVR